MDYMEMIDTNPCYDIVASEPSTQQKITSGKIEQHSTSSKGKKKQCGCTRCLIAIWTVNFVLILVAFAIFAYILTQMASKSDVKAEIQGLKSSGLRGPKGDTGPSGTPGLRGVTGLSGAKGDKGDCGVVESHRCPASLAGGVSYIRWGRSFCRSSTTLIYSGRTGSTPGFEKGGASNYICMPDDPQYTLPHRPGVQEDSYVYGTEYERPPPPRDNRHQHNAVCAVCYVPTKHTTIMIPAHTSCPTGWTMEYHGYLISEHRSHYRTMYQCADVEMEYVNGSEADIDGGHFYFVEANCSGLSCPPYDNEKELGCVVCSK